MTTTSIGTSARWTAWLLACYLAAVAVATLVVGVSLTPDIFLVYAGAAAVFLGLGRRFVRDWVPFIGIFISWQAMRGISHQHLGMPVQSDSIIAIERALFAGRVPTEVLQRWLYVPGEISALDVAATFVYKAHFWVPFVVGFWIWLRARDDFPRFAVALLALSLVSFATALLLPVAPPRFAGQYGEALAVTDIVATLWREFSWTTTWIYQQLNGNPVAAMPSLHAAYPALLLLFLRERWPFASWAMAAWSAIVWFAIVYLGHHYVIDAVAGALYAVGVYVIVRRFWPEPRAAPVKLSQATVSP